MQNNIIYINSILNKFIFNSITIHNNERTLNLIDLDTFDKQLELLYLDKLSILNTVNINNLQFELELLVKDVNNIDALTISNLDNYMNDFYSYVSYIREKGNIALNFNSIISDDSLTSMLSMDAHSELMITADLNYIDLTSLLTDYYTDRVERAYSELTIVLNLNYSDLPELINYYSRCINSYYEITITNDLSNYYISELIGDYFYIIQRNNVNSLIETIIESDNGLDINLVYNNVFFTTEKSKNTIAYYSSILEDSPSFCNELVDVIAEYTTRNYQQRSNAFGDAFSLINAISFLMNNRSWSIDMYNTNHNNILIETSASYIEEVVYFFKHHINLQAKSFSDLVCIDLLDKPRRFNLIYNLLSINYHTRYFIGVYTTEVSSIKSLTHILPAINWYERECWDLFGVHYSGHPDLRRILTDYGFYGHPLRKDFPLTGFVECYYNTNIKTIVYKTIQLPQEYRMFNTTTPWDFFTEITEHTYNI